MQAYGTAEQTREHEDWRERELRELGELADARRGVIAQLEVDLDAMRLGPGASSFLPEQLYALLHQVTAKRGRTDNLQLLVCSEIHVELMRCLVEHRYSESMFTIRQTPDDYAMTFAGVPVRRDRELDNLGGPGRRTGRVMACPLRREPERMPMRYFDQPFAMMEAMAEVDRQAAELGVRMDQAELERVKKARDEAQRKADLAEERAAQLADIAANPPMVVPSHLEAELEEHRADAERRRAEDAKIDRELATIGLHLRALLGTATTVGAIAYVLYLCGVFG